MLRWRLGEVMARARITNRELARVLGRHESSLCRLKAAETMPRIDGHHLDHLCNSLNHLYRNKGVKIVVSPADLFEYIPEEIEENSNSNHEPSSN